MRESQQNQPLVVFEGVTLKIDDDLFFPNTDWTIREGEHWAIQGGTGSGKSILAEALLRRIQVCEGRIEYYLDGVPRAYFDSGQVRLVSIQRQRELMARGAGYVQARWQSSEQAQSPTAREFLGYRQSRAAAEPLAASQRDEETLRALEVDYLLDRRIISLSSGELRKLALAEALLAGPRLLILDDPFPGLDQDSQIALRRLLELLCRRTRPGLILVTSHPDEIPAGITHAVLVESRRIVRMGSKSEITPPVVSPGPEGRQASLEKAVGAPPAPGEPVIEMKDVTVRYGGVTILDSVSWLVREGEKWAILGPNGAGKTTLLSLVLADNPQAYTNDIRLFSRKRGSGESIWDIKKKIGWVSSELQLFYPPEANAFDVILSGFFDSVGLYRACTEEQTRLARQWARDLDVSALLARPYYSLSAGEQRLVLLARALVKQPRLLVLDEPGQGLDPVHVERFLEKLDSLCGAQPTTLLYVTHRPEELPRSVSRVLRLERGKVAV